MNAKFQHYVPQGYLRSFNSEIIHGEYRIWCYRKSSKNKFYRNINKIAGEYYYYDQNRPDGSKYSIENWFHDIEGRWPRFVREIEISPTPETILSNLTTISEFIAYQSIRAPAGRTGLRELGQLLKRALPANVETDMPIEDNEEFWKERQAYIVSQAPETAKQLQNKQWLLIKNKSKTIFITSDNPVVSYNQTSDNIAFLAPNVEIFLPITPYLGVHLSDFKGSTWFPKVVEVTDRLNPKTVTEMNNRQVEASKDFLFSKDGDFGIVEKLINQYPQLANPNRPRIDTNAKVNVNELISQAEARKRNKS